MLGRDGIHSLKVPGARPVTVYAARSQAPTASVTGFRLISSLLPKS